MAKDRSRWWRRFGLWALLVALLAVAVVLGIAWWRAPELYDSVDAETQATATATTRAGILAVFAATIAAIGATVALYETRRANRDADQRERYTNAINQLGNDNLDVRLGGIYGLERIAKDSPRDLSTVVEVLCAFVRGHGRGPDDDSEEALARHLPPTDVQAALTVIGRVHSLEHGSNADLQRTHLERADLAHANLRAAVLLGANLRAAWLKGADLGQAVLGNTNLTGAALDEADLGDAVLNGANLAGATLFAAVLRGAVLRGADLRGTDLTGARYLSREQLNFAAGDEHTRLPEGVTQPASWTLPPPDDSGASAKPDRESG